MKNFNSTSKCIALPIFIIGFIIIFLIPFIQVFKDLWGFPLYLGCFLIIISLIIFFIDYSDFRKTFQIEKKIKIDKELEIINKELEIYKEQKQLEFDTNLFERKKGNWNEVEIARHKRLEAVTLLKLDNLLQMLASKYGHNTEAIQTIVNGFKSAINGYIETFLNPPAPVKLTWYQKIQEFVFKLINKIF